jgi:molecular chaperone DnaJ
MPKDHYVVLGISRGSDLNKIKKAYRTVAKKYHPDVNQSLEGRKRFLEIRDAYETLSDETKKKDYDQELAKLESPVEFAKVHEGMERRRAFFDRIEQLFSSSADEYFEGFVPGFFDTGQKKIREKDLFYEAVLSPEEAARGGLFRISVPVFEQCPRCVKTGLWKDSFCPVCNGYGRIRSERHFSLNIPPHVKQGTEVRISMEDIDLNNTYLHVTVLIDPELSDENW